MITNKLLHFIAALLITTVTLTSCQGEIENAQALVGTWEGGDLGLSHEFRGQTLKPYKTVFVFEQDNSDSWFGSGYMVEYFHHDMIQEVYYRTNWSTFNGKKEIEITISGDYGNRRTFVFPSSNLDGNIIKGEAKLEGTPINNFELKRIATKPDISKAQFWGFNELMVTWHTTTYAGPIGLTREYQGKEYTPSNVVITFDVDPAYNTGGWENCYIREEYTDAPWGSYLADRIKEWNIYGNEMLITTEDGTTYSFLYLNVTEEQLTAQYFVKTNVFVPFTLKRSSNPEWSSISQWGITSRLK